MCERLLGNRRKLVMGTRHVTFCSNEAGWLRASVSHWNRTLQEFSCKSLFPLCLSYLCNFQGKRQRQSLSAGVLSSKNILHPRPKVHHILKGLWICMFSHLHPNVFLWEHYSVLVIDPKRTPIKTSFLQIQSSMVLSLGPLHESIVSKVAKW